MGGGGAYSYEPDRTTIDPKWFEGLEPGVPIENPIKVGLLFPPKFTGPNAPSAEEYKSGAVSSSS